MLLAVLFTASFQQEPHNPHLGGILHFTTAYTRTLDHLLKGDINTSCASKVSRSSKDRYEDMEETSSQEKIRQQ